MIFKQSTAAHLPFFMVDSTDSITGKTGLTPTVTLSKNGGAFGAAAGAVTEIGNGWYDVAVSTVDTNTIGSLALHASATGADNADPEPHQVCLDLPGAAVSISAQAIWDVLTSAQSTVGSLGKLLVDNINATIGSRNATAPDNTSIATILTRVDVATSTRLASSSYTAPTTPDNAGIAAIKLKTDNLPSDPADQSLVIAAADAIMGRLGAPTGASVSADIVAVKNDTAGIKTKTDQLGFTGSNVNANAQVMGSQIEVKKNTALNAFLFLMTDSGTHDPASGQTVSVSRSIDGNPYASCSNAASEVGLGTYKINLSATDLNGGVIMLRFSATGCDTRYLTIITQA